MVKYKASQILGIEESRLKHFKVQDPFNPEWYLEGYISNSEKLYGSMIIFKINDYLTEQVVISTPKQQYPFDKLGRFKFPTAKHINVYSKLDGCLFYDTKILLADGSLRQIRELENDIGKEVLTYNETTGRIEPKPIIGFSKYPHKNFVKIKFSKYDRRKNGIRCTPDHPFFTKRDGWVEAQNLNLSDDVLIYTGFNLFPVLEEILVGCILGDACIRKMVTKKNGIYGTPNLNFNHCDKQKEYLEFKFKLLKQIVRSDIKECTSGYGKKGWNFSTSQSQAFSSLYALFINVREINSKIRQIKCVSSGIYKYITPISLAFWYMDDGSLQRSFKQRQRPRAMLHTQGFDTDSIDILVSILNDKFNLEAKLIKNTKTIQISADGSERFFTLISPYILECMQYKVPEKFRLTSCVEQLYNKMEFKDYNWVKMTEIKPYIPHHYKWRYNITVKDNSCYFANRVLVHNTNILAYSYKIKGKRYITYKTRLTPVLNESRWGNWKKMWDEMLEKYKGLPWIIEKWQEYGINLSFELWGSRNKHLIEYTTSLDVSLLFGIRNDIENPKIIDPENLRLGGEVPVATLRASIESGADLYSWYQKLRNQQEALNKFTDEGFIIGEEGAVWYLLDINGIMHQYKMKPESIEAIHWAASGLSKHSITTTIINCYEKTDDVTYEVVKELLLEEWDDRGIESKKDLIIKCMADVRYRIEFRDNCQKTFTELGFDLKTPVPEAMRALSKYFVRKDMRKVYNTIYGELK